MKPTQPYPITERQRKRNADHTFSQATEAIKQRKNIRAEALLDQAYKDYFYLYELASSNHETENKTKELNKLAEILDKIIVESSRIVNPKDKTDIRTTYQHLGIDLAKRLVQEGNPETALNILDKTYPILWNDYEIALNQKNPREMQKYRQALMESFRLSLELRSQIIGI